MNKERIKTIGQLILDIITAVWLILLSFLGTSCVSAGDNSPVSTDTSVDIEFPEFDTNKHTLSSVSGDLISFLEVQ